jgi:hypothetical protein
MVERPPCTFTAPLSVRMKGARGELFASPLSLPQRMSLSLRALLKWFMAIGRLLRVRRRTFMG